MLPLCRKVHDRQLATLLFPGWAAVLSCRTPAVMPLGYFTPTPMCPPVDNEFSQPPGEGESKVAGGEKVGDCPVLSTPRTHPVRHKHTNATPTQAPASFSKFHPGGGLELICTRAPASRRSPHAPSSPPLPRATLAPQLLCDALDWPGHRRLLCIIPVSYTHLTLPTILLV